jgi:rfaE bifunctional protein kinase chain/domain
LCGITGTDTAAKTFLDCLAAAGLSDRGILTSPRRMTTVKTRIIAGHQQLLRLDKERKEALSASENESLLERIRQIMSDRRPDAIILQDYDKGLFSAPSIQGILAIASGWSVPVTVDPKYDHFWQFQGSTLFKPNLKEVSDALRRKISADDPAGLQSAADKLHKKLGHQYTLITLAEKGLFLADHRAEAIESGNLFPTRKRAVRDVCGAGDTVISVATLALAAGLPLYEIARLANLSGGQVVEHIGAVPVNKTVLAQEYYQEISMASAENNLC